MIWFSGPLFSQIGSSVMLPSAAVAGVIIGGMLLFGQHVFHGLSWLMVFFARRRTIVDDLQHRVGNDR